MNIFGIITVVLAALANLVNLPFTYMLIDEQMKTGFGFPTNFELAVLYPWMIEIVCLPIVIVSLIFLIMNCLKKSSKPIFVLNLCLFAVLVLQYLITNLFIFY